MCVHRSTLSAGCSCDDVNLGVFIKPTDVTETGADFKQDSLVNKSTIRITVNSDFRAEEWYVQKSVSYGRHLCTQDNTLQKEFCAEEASFGNCYL
jgi:hypothetical protein